MPVTYAVEPTLSVKDFERILAASGLDERRPANDPKRLEAMLAGANLTLVARDEAGEIVGLARCVTDFSYCLYCSDLAVDRGWQGRGIGRALLDAVVAAAPNVKTFLLLSAPGAVGFYERQGYERAPDAFIFNHGS